MDTIYLSPSWDMTLDSSGNIAMASNPYALAQDAASEIKTFEGEVYYDTNQGIPYFTQILGENPPLELIRSWYEEAALKVPEVIDSQVFFSDINNRVLSGQIQVTDKTGVITTMGF